eukprot:GDKJ01001301.1.p1 GENE.GDKJ01001301.1~~GDKJ01001301.1.p1  ORF type:complete len:216 (+),score=38.21 GDKJ01001301.1:31-678(+)
MLHWLLLTLLLVISAFFVWKYQTNRRPEKIVLIGTPDSGKTTLFYELFGQTVETVSSLTYNQQKLELSNGVMVPIVDVPGHSRMRAIAMELLESATKVVFMIDSSEKQDIPIAAEFLFEILTSKFSERLNLLICCTKQDLRGAARSPDVVIKDLQREIERLRNSRSALLEDEKAEDVYLGAESEAFKFENLTTKISWCGSGFNSNQEVKSFITNC